MCCTCQHLVSNILLRNQSYRHTHTHTHYYYYYYYYYYLVYVHQDIITRNSLTRNSVNYTLLCMTGDSQ